MNTMNKLINRFLRQSLQIAVASLGLVATVASAAPVDFTTTPLANTPLTAIKPNMLYVMDDSGSMGRDYMPDWANDNAAFFDDASYNSIAYNPAIRYLPPVNFTTSGKDTATYPSQTGLSTSEGASSSGKPNWQRVKYDPYLSGGTSNLESFNGGLGPQFWVTVPTEYCTTVDLTDCIAATTPSATHQFPASIRWCRSNADAAAATPAAGRCQATRIQSGGTTYNSLRAPAAAGPAGVPVATITFTNASSTPRITSIRVGGQEILRWRTSSSNNESNLASWVRDRINDCTASAWWNCSVSGFSATASGNVVTIYSPYPTTATPVVSHSSGNVTKSSTAFNVPPATPGGRIQVTINSGNNSYPYPGQTTKASERTDCLGTTCTYNEEMTNYANWYAYYRTRILMMKTASSLAFETMGSDFRVGYMTIHPGSNQRINFDTYENAHKAAWYSRLFATTTGSATPLRAALSTAGRIYADKDSVSGTFTDPMEYECQQNFTLLTTDGFWNSGNGQELDGSTMGNHDGAGTAPPKFEGNTATSNTLADVAKYYRDTDLRSATESNCTGALGTNVCESPSGSVGPAPNQKQSMVTLTLGLGVDGTMTYKTDYKTATTGDYADIKNGTKNWPVPTDNDIRTIDDLWHAAVNGDGTYFSAKKPNDLVRQLKEAIASIQVKLGSGATAAASSQNPVAGSNNFFYISTYNSGIWTGNLEKKEIDLVTLDIKPSAVACVEDVVPTANCTSPSFIQSNGSGGYECVTPSATAATCTLGTLVGTDCKVPVASSCTGVLKSQATRRILFNNSGTLQPFDYSNLTGVQQTTFDPPFLLANLTQGPGYTPAQVANLTGDKLVDYLKGDTTYDLTASNADNQLFRNRQAILGDLVASEPIYVEGPNAEYGDPGYQDFKAANASRQKVVYVGGNDGMLHAFDADTLQELWAYVPSMVIPNLWKLADTNYASKHSFYVEGDPVIADVCIAANCATATASDWRTILVSGLDSGGRGYFALDITNPLSPQLMWEFDASATNGDANLGYTYSKPVVTKRSSDNAWVVLITSGYNNIPDNDPFYSLTTTKFKPNNPAQFTTGDGVGRLYVLDAKTGSKMSVISTGVGTTTNPSGLGQVASFTPNQLQTNVTQYVYVGDLLGNLWRFDISANTVNKFAELVGPSGQQPITTRPQISLVGQKPIILVGTGKYMEQSDLSNTDTQTLYGITDSTTATTTPLINPRTSPAMVEQVLSTSATNSDERFISSYTVNLTGSSPTRGWFVDLPDLGERQNVNAELVLGTLLVPTIVPESSACQPDGYSWEYELNYKTGGAVIIGQASGTRYTSPTTGYAVLSINGKPVRFRFNSKGTTEPGKVVTTSGSGTGFQLKRSIWREIVD